ncbi:MAG TPA: DUF4340 domain-containing protein [Anaerolineales bacterium]|jgi:hypothetical protein|nr:DUF4340 domain-containing protein [Anaerolineales bacterium]
MIRRSTVVYIVLLLALAGVYYYLNNRPQPAEIELTGEPGTEAVPIYLFTAEEGTPTSIRIESKAGETVEVARGEDEAWALTEPVKAIADQASAEAAASQVTTMRVLETVPDVDLSIVGLQDPEYVLTIEFTSGGERSVDVGVITPSESGYYVRDGEKVVIVSRSAIDALLGLLTSPPYLETPTPETGVGTASNETATPQP